MKPGGPHWASETRGVPGVARTLQWCVGQWYPGHGVWRGGSITGAHPVVRVRVAHYSTFRPFSTNFALFRPFSTIFREISHFSGQFSHFSGQFWSFLVPVVSILVPVESMESQRSQWSHSGATEESMESQWSHSGVLRDVSQKTTVVSLETFLRKPQWSQWSHSRTTVESMESQQNHSGVH